MLYVFKHNAIPAEHNKSAQGSIININIYLFISSGAFASVDNIFSIHTSISIFFKIETNMSLSYEFFVKWQFSTKNTHILMFLMFITHALCECLDPLLIGKPIVEYGEFQTKLTLSTNLIFSDKMFICTLYCDCFLRFTRRCM